MTGHIVTYTGKAIEPLNPDPALIDVMDIAHALSNCCRFCGHVRVFYSVAEHSVRASRIVSPENALCALLHDASEAYLSDIARPIKQQPAFGDVYKAAEERLMLAISEALGFEWPAPPEVKRADEILLVTEARDLMHGGVSTWSEPLRSITPLDERIKPWSPSWAKSEFLHRFHALANARGERE